MRLTVANFSHAFNLDLVDQDPPYQRRPFRMFDPMLHDLLRSLQNID